MSKGKTEFRFRINADSNIIENVIQGYLNANSYKRIPTNDNANCYLFNDTMGIGKCSLEYYINGNDVLILAYLGTYKSPRPLDGLVGALPKQVYRQRLSSLFSELEKLENSMKNNMYQNNNSNPNNMYNPNQSMNNTNNMYNPNQTINNANNMYNPNQSMSNANNMYNPNQSMSNANNIYNPNQNINNTSNVYNPNQNMNNSNNIYNPNNSFNTFADENNKRNEKFATIGFVISLFGLLAVIFGYVVGALIIIFEFYCASLGLKSRNKRGLSIATIVIASLTILITFIEIIIYLFSLLS